MDILEFKKQEKEYQSIFKVNFYYVYSLENVKNGRKYYGITKKLIKRWEAHKMDLDSNRHGNKLMMNDLKNGVLKGKIIDICFNKEDAMEIEKELIKNDSNCYNIMGTGKGKPRSYEDKKLKKAVKLFHDRANNGLSVNDIVSMTGVPRATIYVKAKEMGNQ